MKKLTVNLQNCYGIRRLKEEFIFKNRTFSIYAPNGVMKTSFAKTFFDLSNGEISKDLHFPNRDPIMEIEVDDKELKQEQVFVIEPYNESYDAEVSTLLVNKELKKQYGEHYKNIDKAQKDLIKKLKQLSGLTGRNDDVEKIFTDIYGESFLDYVSNPDFLDFIEKEESSLDFVPYKIFFNEKVLKVIESGSFKTDLKEYIEKYNDLINNSPILQKDFTITHAQTVQDQLFKNNFFKAGHFVNLQGRGEAKNDDDLKSILEEEKNKVLNNEDLLKKFNTIDSKISNVELKDLRQFLLENKEILPLLENLDKFKKDIFTSYLIMEKDLVKNLVSTYDKSKVEIVKIIEEAKNHQTEWEEVVSQFNNKFSHLPFYLEVENKEDVLLKSEAPSVVFIFKDEVTKEEVRYKNKKDLINKLSTGEERALYILNIIFEVEKRKKEDYETLFIIDDIADSFDYKNKYAIVEYLKEISEFDKFYMMILTHNFDFFRTIQSRAVVSYGQCLIAVKNDEKVVLESIKDKHVLNPFLGWKNDLDNNKKLIASIPFIRNIIEYTAENDDDYKLLTSVLHFKDDTPNIKFDAVKKIFKNCIPNIKFPDISDKKVVDLIFETADECLTADEGMYLENKIVLSIAIRLKAEKFMKSQISDKSEINSFQTKELFNRYSEEFNNEKGKIEILKRVNLITPANIHINAFMYEPILDMGDGELRDLYTNIKAKLATE